MMRERTDREVAKELDELRARLAAAQLEEEQRRKELEQLRKDFARLSEQLRRQRAEHEHDV
jgi:predicted nuclease with TOPRIM domain